MEKIHEKCDQLEDRIYFQDEKLDKIGAMVEERFAKVEENHTKEKEEEDVKRKILKAKLISSRSF